MSGTACCVYDFSAAKAKYSLADVKTLLAEMAKAWTFQEERGEESTELNPDGYEHYQGRMSLKVKVRPDTFGRSLAARGITWKVSVTSNENKGNNFYVTKSDTRVAGPWSDTDPEPVYIPVQYRDKKLRPGQQRVIDSRLTPDPRGVDCLYDPDGDRGKTMISVLAHLMYGGVRLPSGITDPKDISAALCCILRGTNNRRPGIVTMDMPRAMPKQKLHGMYSAIEEIKNGICCDQRNKFREWYFDTPAVWVFTNAAPHLGHLSLDRWRFWRINADDDLERIPVGEMRELSVTQDLLEAAREAGEPLGPLRAALERQIQRIMRSPVVPGEGAPDTSIQTGGRLVDACA